MKLLTIIISIALNTLVWSQEKKTAREEASFQPKQEKLTQHKKRRYTLSGSLSQSSFHQGGAPREYIPNSVILPNYTLNLIRFNSKEAVPEIVKTFTSDSLGAFQIEVYPGIYGFANIHDTLRANQWLPQGHNFTDGQFNSASTWWECFVRQSPIVVEDRDEMGIMLTKHSYSSCGICP